MIAIIVIIDDAETVTSPITGITYYLKTGQPVYK
jgi:hypothetical protein